MSAPYVLDDLQRHVLTGVQAGEHARVTDAQGLIGWTGDRGRRVNEYLSWFRRRGLIELVTGTDEKVTTARLTEAGVHALVTGQVEQPQPVTHEWSGVVDFPEVHDEQVTVGGVLLAATVGVVVPQRSTIHLTVTNPGREPRTFAAKPRDRVIRQAWRGYDDSESEALTLAGEDVLKHLATFYDEEVTVVLVVTEHLDAPKLVRVQLSHPISGGPWLPGEWVTLREDHAETLWGGGRLPREDGHWRPRGTVLAGAQ